ncbi:SRPBCC domain-containing protein [Actinomadura latina]|uniref:SRPBCC domain-containing protein n=1 Tax=Actinomadura latina TaxID=163603 RepID=A0A846Z681_9ACTN|nr:SRPBCC domain-containing protein [Actinomadura latina]NKZ08549.1 SRPBCC domain-containing protein [Actinomadura latina]
MTTTAAAPVPARTHRPRRRRLLIALGIIAVLLAGYATWTNVRPFTLRASIEIDATPEQVWTVLSDLPAYPQWNPFIVSSSGRLEKGATLRNVMRDSGGDTTFTPTVLEAAPGRELRWIGKIGPGGIFDGEHRFLIEPITPGRVRLTQSERFTGVLIPFFQNQLTDRTLPQFQAMNKALAQRVSATRP